MTVDHGSDYLGRRQRWTRSEILHAAWEVARRDGVAALSLREVADRVGLRTPSLYHYFPSKAALFDAMYAEGMQQFADQVLTSSIGSDARETLRNRAKTFVASAVADPVRYELLFHRPVPDFTPTPEHVAIGSTVLDTTRQLAAAADIVGQAAFDLFMATIRGLIEVQIANEPRGDRWTRLVDEAVDILTNHYAANAAATAARRRGGTRTKSPAARPQRGKPGRRS
jgi:AcrR family transcriptional regulator